MRISLNARMTTSMLGTDLKEFELEMPEASTILDLLRRLGDHAPGFGRIMRTELEKAKPHPPLVVTVNGKVVGMGHVLADGDAVILLPYAIGG